MMVGCSASPLHLNYLVCLLTVVCVSLIPPWPLALLALCQEGIPHFHDLYEGSPGARKRSNTVLSQCSDDTSVSMKDEFALPKSTAEKLLREAEEESEKVTLGLLHRLEQVRRASL